MNGEINFLTKNQKEDKTKKATGRSIFVGKHRFGGKNFSFVPLQFL